MGGMMMELWNAYLRDGTVTDGILVRDEPIPDGLYHLVTEVLVCHVDGSYLAMRRTADKKVFPGWLETTAGGSALLGEDPLACIRRELAEETGILVQPEQCYLTIHEYYQQWHLISHYFLCKKLGDTQQHLTDYEAQAGLVPKWRPLEDAVKDFSEYRKFEGVNEMRRGAYLREYTALQALPKA
jgi:8-oxo-dGTP pyrophosphatase MutT (NUDIX family)